MDIMEAIITRRSIRSFSPKPISEEDLKTILRAGMSGPSCVNARDWHFIVIRDPETLQGVAAANGHAADPLRRAKAGILICGDLERAFRPAPDYWIIDGAIAGQNMVLAAQGLGIGSVWLGTYPQMKRVKGLREYFGLPETAVPHSVIALGWPEEGAPDPAPQEKYEESRVHWDRW